MPTKTRRALRSPIITIDIAHLSGQESAEFIDAINEDEFPTARIDEHDQLHKLEPAR